MFAYSVRALRASFLTALFAAASLAPAAFAQDANAPAVRWDGFDGTACETEFHEKCQKNASNESSGYTCLRGLEKRGELSAACAEITDQIRAKNNAKAIARQAEWMEACKADLVTHCAEFADAKPATRKGCLGRKRTELSKACDAKLPVRLGITNQNARARWRDGSEPEDWALQNALRDRPRKTQEELDEIGRDAWIARDNARRAEKQEAARKKRQAEKAKAAAE